jgi:triphosphoribosyl-dephospho-CoA synthase
VTYLIYACYNTTCERMKISDVALCAQLACILEVSSPKPGNVNRYYDFKDTRYEHFLASSIAIGRFVHEATAKGYGVGKGNLKVGEVGLGKLIKEAVFESKKWHKGENTNLGIVMLLIPLASACGLTLAQKGNIVNSTLKENFDYIMKGTTYRDALYLYKAIRFSKPGGLGKVEDLDVNDESSDEKIKSKNLNLYQIMKLTQMDTIAKELTTGMRISFEIGYPTIIESYSKSKDINNAIVHCFLKILSEIPDSLIARKNGINVAEEISREAMVLLEMGLDSRGLNRFDRKLRDEKNRLNPGTTADLVASSLMIALLNGVRP